MLSSTIVLLLNNYFNSLLQGGVIHSKLGSFLHSLRNLCSIFFLLRTKDESRNLLSSNGLIESEEVEVGEVALKLHHFKWDKVCPLFLSCIPPDRGLFAQSDLVRKQNFIMLVSFTLHKI